MSKNVYFPNLDGIRTIAFLFVFFIHSFYTENPTILHSPIHQFIKSFFDIGTLGVNLFFVLSGFLITYLILNEEAAKGKLNVSHFYVRRVLRIWPLYFACLIYGFIIEPLAMEVLGKTPHETADPLLFISFLSNFNVIINGGAEVQNLNVLWSVAIEEQFYLFWPLLLLLFKRNRLIVFVSLTIISVVFRFFYLNRPVIIDYHTIAVMSDLAIGGLIGYFSFTSARFVDFFRNLSKGQIALTYLLLLVLLFFRKDLMQNQLFLAFDRIIFSLFFAFAILEQNNSTNSLFKIGNSRLLTSLGKYTYSLYCLHMIGITAGKEITKIVGWDHTLFGVLIAQTVISLLISLVLAYVSYEFYEKYFLKLKEKWTPIKNMVIEKEKYPIFTSSYNWESLNTSKGNGKYAQSFNFDLPVMEALIKQFNYLMVSANDTIWGSYNDQRFLIARAPGIFENLGRKKDMKMH